ncbi:TetR/AcrR family transcriptional regulator [Beggiatoa leptomitoformis]|uniref:TetR/AcrR family transcriptional regulator n=1 Tax=Beggiatoa leptomitoformis TaxID=288004 RepID=UPI0007852697|nr:TetR/AcrR family transcriptional regulator [Beggiatoa leptomitoformis]
MFAYIYNFNGKICEGYVEATLTQKKKQAIVDAAAALFLNKGYGNVSMDEIAAQAGVSKRTVYNHFPSKEVLFSEIVRTTWSLFDIPVMVYHEGSDIRQDLIVFSNKFLIMLRSEQFSKLLRLVMGESGRFPELTALYSESGIRSLVRTLADYLQSTGKDIDDIQLASMHYLGMVKEALFWPVMLGIVPMPSPERDKEIIEKSTDMFIKLYQLA